MAKVSPLISNRRFNWQVRLEALLQAMGWESMFQGEEGTTNARTSITHRGTRLVITGTKLRNGVLRTHVAIYTSKGYHTYVIATKPGYKLAMTGSDIDKPAKFHYQRLERLIYRCFASQRSADIMSRADHGYSWTMREL